MTDIYLGKTDEFLEYAEARVSKYLVSTIPNIPAPSQLDINTISIGYSEHFYSLRSILGVLVQRGVEYGFKSKTGKPYDPFIENVFTKEYFTTFQTGIHSI